MRQSFEVTHLRGIVMGQINTLLIKKAEGIPSAFFIHYPRDTYDPSVVLITNLSPWFTKNGT